MSAQLGKLNVLNLLSAVFGRLATTAHVFTAKRFGAMGRIGIGLGSSNEVVVGLLVVVLGWCTVDAPSFFDERRLLITS